MGLLHALAHCWGVRLCALWSELTNAYVGKSNTVRITSLLCVFLTSPRSGLLEIFYFTLWCLPIAFPLFCNSWQADWLKASYSVKAELKINFLNKSCTSLVELKSVCWGEHWLQVVDHCLQRANMPLWVGHNVSRCWEGLGCKMFIKVQLQWKERGGSKIGKKKKLYSYSGLTMT